MKKTILFTFILCLCFAVFGASYAETAATEAPGMEAPTSEMTPEELFMAGRAAQDAQDYENALKYFQLAVDAGNVEGWRGLGNMYSYGTGVGQDYGRALEY